MKIKHIDRYGSYSGDYMFFVHYENGDMEQETEQTLSKEMLKFMNAENTQFQLRKSKKGEFYHRWLQN